MATYKERVSEVIEILQKSGAKLYKEDKIVGYSISTDSLHSTITNDPEGDWDEYPCAHAIFKFGRQDNPRYAYLGIKLLSKEDHNIGLYPIKITKSLPEIGKLEEKIEHLGITSSEPSGLATASALAFYIMESIEKYKKQNKK